MIRNINFSAFGLFLLCALLIAGCISTPGSLTPTPHEILIQTPEKAKTNVTAQESVAQPTVTLEPSVTPTLTNAPTPTSEETIPLSAEGPWLLYLRTVEHHIAKLDGGQTIHLSTNTSSIPNFSRRIRTIQKPSSMASWGGDEEFAMMNMDGSGRTIIKLPECTGNINAFFMSGENADNTIANIPFRGTYIFRPFQATGMLVYVNSIWNAPGCNTSFSGDARGGLLASIYQPRKDASPELIIYELPEGVIRYRFPLVKCPVLTKDCEDKQAEWHVMGEQTPRWSPNGRYLAFAALVDATSSDLYIYDKQSGNLRQLTNGPDWVGPIEWSPDGTQIIMGEIPNDGEHFFAPSCTPASVWSAPVSKNNIKQLYSGDTSDNHILFWLDDSRYIVYAGDTFNNIEFAGVGRNLRLVDTNSGETRTLFGGSFMGYAFDKIHETFAIPAIDDPPQYPQGIYLVSTKSTQPHYLDGHHYFSFDWDEKTGLFVSNEDCEKDPQGFLAFDHQGNFTCVPKPKSTPTPGPLETTLYPSPNRKWTVFLKNGVWLKDQGKTAVQISPEIAVNIIWCPDSSCFFFSGPRDKYRRWALYRVSLPDLTVKMVDEWPGPQQGNIFVNYSPYFQWLEITK